MTRKREVISSLIILFGISTVYIHTLVGYFYPIIFSKDHLYILWKDKNYKEALTIGYYMFEIEQIIAWAICFFGFWVALKTVSKLLCKVILIFMLYFLTQIGFYIWDRNTSDISNNIVYIYIALALIYILIPNKKKGKIMNFHNY